MKTTGHITTEIIEATANTTGWTRIADIAKTTGLTPAQIAEGIADLMDAEGFEVEPEPFNHRITADDRHYGPVIGGEQRHLIRWA
jgi:hypothetical protein